MPYAKNGNIRLYYETVGQGPPLLLQQGYAMTLEVWTKEGHVDALKDEFTLIMMDPRGIGRSDRPTNPDDYAGIHRAKDCVTILDDLGIDKAHLWGYSYGAQTGWYCARHHPQRFRSLVIGGASPYCGGVEGEPTPFGQWLQGIGLEDLIGAFREFCGDYWKPYLETMLREQSLDALVAARSIYRDVHRELFLDTLSIPVLCYAGDADQPTHDYARDACEIAPHGRFVSLPDASHMDAGLFEPDHMLPQAIAFFEEVEAGLTLETT